MSRRRQNHYCGRFAPSPTGPLHFGSLVAAMGSYLDALSHSGHWLVRIEDLDPPREVPGAASDILRTLEAFGFSWDGPVLYQSSRIAAYQAAVEQLKRGNWAYECSCSRREIQQANLSGVEGPIYPGTCRTGAQAIRQNRAIRVITDANPISFIDGVQGTYQQRLEQDVGDFVLQRSDGLFAYQLAVVVDDAYQQVTDIVRGSDLLISTPRQIYLQQRLNLPTPNYAHLPLVLDTLGQKLSKQSAAMPVERNNPVTTLIQAFKFLQADAFETARPTSVEEFWQIAINEWNIEKVQIK